LLRDFTDLLEDLLLPPSDKIRQQVPLLVFLFSDPAERLNSFLIRMFSKNVLDHPNVRQLSLNPPTDALIEK